MDEKQSAQTAGILGPLLLCAWAIWAVSDGMVRIRGRGGAVLVLDGFDAAFYALSLMSVALFMHLRLFWPYILVNRGYVQIAEFAALVIFVGAVGCLIARQFLDFL